MALRKVAAGWRCHQEGSSGGRIWTESAEKAKTSGGLNRGGGGIFPAYSDHEPVIFFAGQKIERISNVLQNVRIGQSRKVFSWFNLESALRAISTESTGLLLGTMAVNAR